MRQSALSRRNVALSLSLLATGCIDEDPVGQRLAPDDQPAAFSAATLPDELIFEDPPMLAIAREVHGFGGFYYNDAGEIEVAVTDEAAFGAAEARIRSVVGTERGATARMVSRSVDYPFLELACYRTVLRQRVFGIDGVVSLGVRESANRVKVGVERPEVEQRVRDILPDLGIPQEALMVVVEGAGTDLGAAGRLPASPNRTLTLQDQHPQGLIQGGWEIRRPGVNQSHVCTLGFAVLRASDASPGFVTNSHCTEIRTAYDGAEFRQPSGPVIGEEILDPPWYVCPAYFSCRNSDSALIEAHADLDLGRIARPASSTPVGCEHCVGDLTVDSSQPYFTITAKVAHVFENELLNKVGRTTGWTRGDVEDTCDDRKSELEGSGDPWVKECSDRVDLNVDSGDSGSPVFSILANGTVELRGIVFAEQSCCWGFQDSWMSDLHQIEQDLGVLTVFDPGPPAATVIGPTEVPPGVQCTWGASVTAGVPPFSYAWSGLFSGSGQSTGGSVGSGGDLNLEVTDGLGRQALADITIVIEGDPGPLIC
jgi:hypothetical protein